MAEQETAKPFDFEHALAALAKARMDRSRATVLQVAFADRFPSRLAREFHPEAVETAGLALVLAASFITELIREGLTNPGVLANVLAFIGQRIATDARLAERHATTDQTNQEGNT